MPKDTNQFVERDAESAELSVDKGYLPRGRHGHPDRKRLRGERRDHDQITDPEDNFAGRTLSAQTDSLGSFSTGFVADPDGNLETHIVAASDGSAVRLGELPGRARRRSDLRSSDRRRPAASTALALITDPGYATFHGGPANVTPAKVTLMNRVEPGLRGRSLDHAPAGREQRPAEPEHVGRRRSRPNGPCGAAACFTQSQVTGCSSTTRARFVIGQIIGASNYDIGHLALGQPGGGVANLGVVGRSNKAGGCTGIPTPTGDFYAIDYVAHEMGHQFSGNHPFNGTQLNCSGGNRNAATSVEPGSRLLDHGLRGHLPRPTTCRRTATRTSRSGSLQEISTYTSSNQAAINEVQTASLRHFGGGNEVQVGRLAPASADDHDPAALASRSTPRPSATQLGGVSETGNTVTDLDRCRRATHTLQPATHHDLGRRRRGLQRHVHGRRRPHLAVVHTTRTRSRASPGPAAARSRCRARRDRGRQHRDDPHDGSSTTARSATSRHDQRRRRRRLQRHVRRSPRSRRRAASSTPPRPPASPNSGGGTVTFTSPFQVRIGGNDSAVIGGSGLRVHTTPTSRRRSTRIAGFAGNVTVTGAASTGFTVTYGGALAARLDVPTVTIINLSCGGCFASVEETNHGGANDSFTLNYNGNVSAPIVNGVNYTAAGIQAALTPLLPAGGTATVAGFAGGALQQHRLPGDVHRDAGRDERPGHARRAGLHARAPPASWTRRTRAARSTTRAGSSRPPATRSRS